MKYNAEVAFEKDSFDTDALGKVLIALNVIAIVFFAGWGCINVLGGTLLGGEEEDTERGSKKSTSVVQVLKNQSRALKRLVSNVSTNNITTTKEGAENGESGGGGRETTTTEEEGDIEMEVVVGVNPMTASISRGEKNNESNERT